MNILSRLVDFNYPGFESYVMEFLDDTVRLSRRIVCFGLLFHYGFGISSTIRSGLNFGLQRFVKIFSIVGSIGLGLALAIQRPHPASLRLTKERPPVPLSLHLLLGLSVSGLSFFMPKHLSPILQRIHPSAPRIVGVSYVIIEL